MSSVFILNQQIPFQEYNLTLKFKIAGKKVKENKERNLEKHF